MWALDEPSSGSKQSDESQYVGAETCQPCHDDVYGRFSESPHQKLLASTDPAKQGCEACHGPGAEHANSNGDVSKIFRFGEAKPAAVRSRCLVCHGELKKDFHAQHPISCLKCHSAHHYTQKQNMLVRSQEQLCQGCHTRKFGEKIPPTSKRLLATQHLFSCWTKTLAK
jgi:predicted CXXCH cytochrome family protein